MARLVGKKVGPTGFGLMGMTWREEIPPAEQSFGVLRKSLSLGANFWNGGEIYGNPERNSLHLLNEYFTKYPEDREKIVLSIKGGCKKGAIAPDGSEENVKRSIDECLAVLDGKAKLDVFEMARVDPKVPVEESIGYIAKYVKEGKVGGIGLSEVSANTIRRAAKVHEIASVEVEFSLWATDILENGIASACAELNIPIVAYSPLGRGFLTGQIKTVDDIPERLKIFPRFQPDVFESNIDLVTKVNKVAESKGCSAAQIAIAWIKYQSGRNGQAVIIPIPGATTEARLEENMSNVELTDAEFEQIQAILNDFKVKGDRYGGHGAALMNG